MEWLVKRALSIRSATSPRFGPRGEVYYLSDVTGQMHCGSTRAAYTT